MHDFLSELSPRRQRNDAITRLFNYFQSVRIFLRLFHNVSETELGDTLVYAILCNVFHHRKYDTDKSAGLSLVRQSQHTNEYGNLIGLFSFIVFICIIIML